MPLQRPQQTQHASLQSAISLLTGRAIDLPMSRRMALQGMLGTAALTLAPLTLSQVDIPTGQARLIFNENPYGPSPKAIAEVAKIMPNTAYYPGEIEEDLIALFMQRHLLDREQVFLASGSNEGLQAAMMAFGRQGSVISPSLTYSDHLDYAEKLGVEVLRVPLRDDMAIDLEAMARAVDSSVSLVYLCNPNNPTGMAIDGDELRSFCKEVGQKVPILIDEAYNELTDNPDYTSMVDLLRDGANMLITRTFSKIFGMAGLRVGYGMGHPDIVRVVKDNVMAWPNGVGLYAAYHSYLDEEFIAFSREKILQGREMVNTTFRRHGIAPLPSQTNFVYADIGRDATAFKEQMASRNVLIRGAYEGYGTYSRVSMGRIEDLVLFDRAFEATYLAG
ncbi:MAG: histidinol-phosphate transaminase [Luminiphilus sp.]|jgi:histidinol-phosphate aminotransferase|nr:histidinol-phosphate transaminase [Luminiphilus sp.]